MSVPPRAAGCALCGHGGLVESDRNKFEYAQMARHIDAHARVSTRGQYQRLLKRHGLTDDIPTKEIARLAQDGGKRERVREERIRAFTDRLEPQMRQKDIVERARLSRVLTTWRGGP